MREEPAMRLSSTRRALLRNVHVIVCGSRSQESSTNPERSGAMRIAGESAFQARMKRSRKERFDSAVLRGHHAKVTNANIPWKPQQECVELPPKWEIRNCAYYIFIPSTYIEYAESHMRNRSRYYRETNCVPAKAAHAGCSMTRRFARLSQWCPVGAKA